MLRTLLCRWRAPRLRYHHQMGVCVTGQCPGHTVRATPAGLDRIDALRTAGQLDYLGPADRPAWLTRLTR